ncbi:MAG: hypothetical protein JO161_09705 [Planctomycetaceae bacterium]|nr:hypothetical protein [Planctomycetaceae bacterium]
MDHRPTPRLAATDEAQGPAVDLAESRPRMHRLDFSRGQRPLDIKRVLLAGVAVFATLAASLVVGKEVLHRAVEWLQRQPEYQLRFLDIELSPPPPPWFRGGAEAFLRQVKENRREDDFLPILTLEPGRIASDFKLFPWVEDVPRIEYPPQSIKVHLVYKKPVATMTLPTGERIVLDGQGHLLPTTDIDEEKLGPLIKIAGTGLVHSPGNRPGEVWKSAALPPEAGKQEHAVLGAARLAAFLSEPSRASKAATLPALRFWAIYATDPPYDRGLFVRSEEDIVLWGSSPGEKTTGEPDAEEKWTILEKWATNARRSSLPPGSFWTFSRSELRPVETNRGRRVPRHR